MISVFLFAQSKDELQIIKNTTDLHQAVFVTKDSTLLDRLVANNVSYGHSGGKLENKITMIRNAIANTTTYPTFKLDSLKVIMYRNTAIVRAFIQSITIDKGVQGNLHLGILLVWQQEKQQWKLTARQAVKI